jgi:putative transposase
VPRLHQAIRRRENLVASQFVIDFTLKNHHIDTAKPRAARHGAGLLTATRVHLALADTDIPTIILSYKYRLRPTRQQHEALASILEDQRKLYNGALEHRIGAYRRGANISLYQQMNELTELRTDTDYGGTPVNLQRWTLRRLDEAYKGFFSRLTRGDKAGFPRFRSYSRWSSFGFAEFSGIRIEGCRLRFKGLPGSLRINLHRALHEGKPLTCAFTKDAKGWSVSIQMRVVVRGNPDTGAMVGIDLGLSTLAALSNGNLIERVRHTKAGAKDIRRKSRALARCKKGSKRRQKIRLKLAKAHAKVSNQRNTYLHQVSARLVREHDLIAVEKLNIRGLSRSMLSGAVHDASWGKLRQYLAYKVSKTGCELIEVDPAHTSQTCPLCGAVKKKELSERVHSCPCGCVLDRDVAAAKVILHRAVVGSGESKRKALAYA